MLTGIDGERAQVTIGRVDVTALPAGVREKIGNRPLMRAYEIAPDEEPADNFADAGDTYYTGYLGAAKRLGIAKGVGDNLFAPEREITRQETFTLMYNTLKAVNRLPEGISGKALSDFSDGGEVAEWAVEAMARLVEAGIVNGNGGLLEPMRTTTRAEMAQLLHNLLGK